MKSCKRFLAALIAAAMLLLCVPALAEAPQVPEVPEGYDGYVVFGVSALTMGWGYIMYPELVPVHEGETLAAVTARVFEETGRACSYYGTVEEGFYLTGVGCEDTEPNVPEYLMNEILAYPDWADEQFGYNFGEWTGEFDDDRSLSAGEYCTMSGWMFVEDNIALSTGADATIVNIGSVYQWFFSVYGWGMDYGVSDGWGSFPLFDNPMEGVSRVEADRLLAELNADEESMDRLGRDSDLFNNFLDALFDVNATQAEIDDAAQAIRDFLNPVFEMGDVNLDLVVNSEDALLVMRYGMGLVEDSDIALMYADYNGDGEIDLSDALLILRAIM
jgi:hypothetical protein